jgi:hypothetical protein
MSPQRITRLCVLEPWIIEISPQTPTGYTRVRAKQSTLSPNLTAPTFQTMSMQEESFDATSSGIFTTRISLTNTSEIGPFHLVLAISQRLGIDFLPITWRPALGLLASGGTAEILQSPINQHMSFALKRNTLTTTRKLYTGRKQCWILVRGATENLTTKFSNLSNLGMGEWNFREGNFKKLFRQGNIPTLSFAPQYRER